MGNKFAALAAIVGFLYLLYQRFMSYYYANSTTKAEDRVQIVDTQIAKQAGKLDADKEKLNEDSKSFDSGNK